MKHHAAERMMVRMMYDPALAERVQTDDAPLRAAGLGEREISWLRKVDRRAWRHDPARRRRTLRALVEELKASSAIALAETKRVAFLEAFFTSGHFHAAVQARGSLVAAYAEFLLAAELLTPQLPEVVRLEAELARCRRELTAAGGPDWRPPARPSRLDSVVRAPGVSCGRFSPDALAAIQAVERFLFECSLMPIVVLADDAPPLELPEPTGAPKVALGLIPTQAGISLVELEPAVFAAIERAREPVPPDEIAAQLVQDEVLIPVIS
jgi:hypothetical protein